MFCDPVQMGEKQEQHPLTINVWIKLEATSILFPELDDG